MENKKSKIIGFRPTPRQDFEMSNICKRLGVKKSSLIRFLIDDFLNKNVYEKLDKIQKNVEEP